jgi:release factor glutamine methyltransferase
MSAEMQTPEVLLKFPPYGVSGLAIGKVIHWRYRLFQQRRHDRRVVLERIGGFPLLVLPGVLNPRLMRSGAFFASQLNAELLALDTEVLDMGTGSGVCAVAAARHASRVVAVDINPVAVRCAQLNALINSLEDTIEVVQGDLFVPVQGRQFDVVLFNPPFIHGTPRNDADRAWRSTNVAERFAAGLTEHLKPAGFALVVLSTYGDAGEFLRQFRRYKFTVKVVAARTFVNERLALVRLQPLRQAGGGGDVAVSIAANPMSCAAYS